PRGAPGLCTAASRKRRAHHRARPAKATELSRIMLRHRLDIPLNQDGSVRFLPWLIALMVYLAGLALAGMLALSGTLAHWDRSLAGTLTVELPPAETGKGDGGLAAALQLLRATPGVVSAEPLSDKATARLIEPWLGTALTPDELALPRLVDLRIDPSASPDLAALQGRLAAAAPGAVLDDHRRWLDRLASLVLSIEATALAIMTLIGAAAVLTVVFTTRAGLASITRSSRSCTSSVPATTT